MFKVFIGTLLCKEESGFDECLKTIRAQKNIQITHNLIKDLSERDGYHQQTRDWLNVQQNFDFFITIDPDMTLLHENVIYDICTRMQQNKINFLQYGLHDYLSNTQIFGLNTFDNTINFHLQNDNLSPEKNYTITPDTTYVYDVTIKGYHMMYCNDLQAFHYGVHRGLKQQTFLLKRIKKLYEIYKDDKRRLYAIQGFIKSNLFDKEKTNFNYQSPELLEQFKITKDLISKIK